MYNINRKGAKISPLLSGKIDQYEYLTGVEIFLMIKVELQNKLRLLTLIQEKLLKNKKKQMKIQMKS